MSGRVAVVDCIMVDGSYFTYGDQPPEQMTLSILQNEASLIGKTSDEEWDINVYLHNGQYYAFFCFTYPLDSNIRLLRKISEP